ncbi:hypothetical protein NBRC116584_03670 [Hydrogenophaga sp. 5NK40-0174]
MQWLDRAIGHSIAYRIHGPEGAPDTWLAVHGGPGGGASGSILQPFDLRRQRVVVIDQRGAGNSRPRGSVRQNTTQALVGDMEALRQSLGVARWSLLAGSWGSVVALAYASAHPDKVDSLVLRGSFALSRREVRGVLLGLRDRPRTPHVGQIARSSWLPAPGAQLASVSRLLQSGALGVAALHVVRRWSLVELALARKGIRRSMRSSALAADPGSLQSQRRFDAQLARQWRSQLARLGGERITKADRAAWRKFRVQAHYLGRSGYMKPADLDKAVIRAASSGIALDWVHGRFDAICPPDNTRRWQAMAQRWASVHTGAEMQWPAGGHLSVEKPLLESLRHLVQRRRGPE